VFFIAEFAFMAGVFSETGRTLGATGGAAIVRAMRSGLSALTPRWLSAALARDPRDILTSIDRDGQASRLTPSGARALGADIVGEFRRLNGAGAALTLVVPSGQVFARSITVPAAALPRLDDVLALDLERATPFKRDAVYAAHRVVETIGSTARVEHVVIKARFVAAVLDAAREAGVPVKAVRVADGAHTALNLLPFELRARSRATRTLRHVTLAVAGGAVLCGVIFSAFQIWRLHEAVGEAEREQVQLTASVAALRRTSQDADRVLQEARFARARRLDQPLAVAVVDDLSRRLPDTTWLTDLRLDEGIIALEGHSANAAELVSLLSRSPHVASASFAAPITRDAQRGTERFQIRLTRVPVQSLTKVSP
jgi:general secretion pathway protein L